MLSLSQIIKSLRESIFQFDMFGYPLNLQIKKSQEFHTLIGLVFSLGIQILVTYSFISLMIGLFEKKSPNVLTNILYEQNPNQYLLEKNTFMLAVALTDDKGVPYFQKQGNYTYQAQLEVCTRTSYANNSMSRDCEPFVLKPCLSLNLSSEIITDMNISKTTLAASLCLSEDVWDNIEISLQGTPQSPIFKGLFISVSQCYNTTMNNECASQDIIDVQLKNAYLAVLVTDKVLNQQQQGYPFQTVTKLSSTRISPQAFKTLNILLRKSTFINYENFYYYFGQQTTYETLQVDHSQEYFELTKQQSFIQVALYFDDRSNVYYRTYDNILNIFGQISGLVELLTLLIGLFINPIIKLSQQLYLTSEVYTIENKQVEEIKIHPDLSFTESENDQLKIMKLKKYFKMKNSKHRINIFNYFKFTGQRKKIIDNSINSLYRKIDASFILNKMIEIDKLKKLILSDDQQTLFNYIHKPKINFEKLNRGKSGSFYEEEDDNFEQKIQSAYESYQRIKQNNQVIDKNLLNLMDKDIKNLFDAQQQLNNSTIKQDQQRDIMMVQTIDQE